MINQAKYLLAISCILLLGITSFNTTVLHIVEEEAWVQNEFTAKDTIRLNKNQWTKITLPRVTSALLVESLEGMQSQLTLIQGSDTLSGQISKSGSDEEMPSAFWIFNSPSDLIFVKSDVDALFKFTYFTAPRLNIQDLFPSKNKNSNCVKPDAIPASVWREGLPDPVPGRIATTVKHCIVHHAAGNNSQTDYINTVRNIYLLHTQANGWDDIGYNFLIAPNGIVFEGRDPQNVADVDNVQGAHFCSKNNGTMGVCLLGDYRSFAPAEVMIDKLINLLTWKLLKENLGAFDSFLHPNTDGNYLGAISLHRNGCATTCPGDSVAVLLPFIKQRVQQSLDSCKMFVSVEKNLEKPKSLPLVKIYPNPNQGKFYALIEEYEENTTYYIKDLQGKILLTGLVPKSGLIQTELTNGSYYLFLIKDKKPFFNYKLIVNRK